MLIQHMDGQVVVREPHRNAVKVWRQGPPFAEHTHTPPCTEWYQQVKLCYLASKQPADAPPWIVTQIQARRRASERAAARAKQERDSALEARLRHQDRLHYEIYEHAIERVGKVLSSKDHFVATREKGKGHGRNEAKKRTTKSHYLEQLVLEPGRPQGHLWMAHKGHYRCDACHLGPRKGLPWRNIKRAIHSSCPMRKATEKDQTLWFGQKAMRGRWEVTKSCRAPMAMDGQKHRSELCHVWWLDQQGVFMARGQNFGEPSLWRQARRAPQRTSNSIPVMRCSRCEVDGAVHSARAWCSWAATSGACNRRFTLSAVEFRMWARVNSANTLEAKHEVAGMTAAHLAMNACK